MPPCTTVDGQAGVTPIPRGVCWPGLSRGGKVKPRFMGKWSPCPQIQRQVVEGLNPSGTENSISPTDPIYPQPKWGRTPVEPPNFPFVPFLVPTLMALLSTAMVKAYGSLTTHAQDIIGGG